MPIPPAAHYISCLLQPYLPIYSTFPQCTRAPVYTILDQIQTQSHSSEGALSSLESSLEDRDKQINQLREQRDRAEKADMQPLCDDVSRWCTICGERAY